MRLEGQSGPRPTGQSLRQFVTPLELDDDVGKILLPASPGLAPPQLQEAPDLRHLDNPSTVTTSSAVLLQHLLPFKSHLHFRLMAVILNFVVGSRTTSNNVRSDAIIEVRYGRKCGASR